MIAVSATVAVSAPEDVHYVEGAPGGHGPVVVLGAGGHRGVTVTACCTADADAAEMWEARAAAAANAAEFHRDRDGRLGGGHHGH